MMPHTMRCPVCGNPDARGRIGRHAFAESGLDDVWLDGVELLDCDRCGESGPMIRDLEGLHRAIAAHLLTCPRRLRPPEFRFLRKFLGWSSQDAAQFFGVTPETMSRWERGRRAISSDADVLLRLAVRHERPVDDYARHEVTLTDRIRRLRALIATDQPARPLNLALVPDGRWMPDAA